MLSSFVLPDPAGFGFKEGFTWPLDRHKETTSQ